MPNPVFVYYELDGYYQNHRLYAQSLSEKQLNGEVLSVGGVYMSIFRSRKIAPPLRSILSYIRRLRLMVLHWLQDSQLILVE